MPKRLQTVSTSLIRQSRGLVRIWWRSFSALAILKRYATTKLEGVEMKSICYTSSISTVERIFKGARRLLKFIRTISEVIKFGMDIPQLNRLFPTFT